MKPPSGPKKQTQSNPIQTQFKACPERSRMGQFQKGQNRLPENLATPLHEGNIGSTRKPV